MGFGVRVERTGGGGGGGGGGGMKGGRDEDKITGPMFPRLHVNDTADKGGPRAPPRNKMALYEQLSIPSQMFNTGGASPWALPQHNTSTSVPSASSCQGCGHERSLFSPFYVSPHMHAHSIEKVHAHPLEGRNPTSMGAGLEGKSEKQGTQKTVNTSGNLLSAAECSSIRPHDFSSAKNSCGKKLEDDDDFRVPTFVQSRVAPRSEKDPHQMDGERTTPFHPNSSQKSLGPAFNSSNQVPISQGKALEQPKSTDLKSRQHVRNNGEQKDEGTITINDCTKKPMSHPRTRDKAREPSNHTNSSSKRERVADKCNESENAQHGSARLCQESSGTLGGPRCLTDIEVMENESTSKARSRSCTKLSLGSSRRTPNVAENSHAEGEDKAPELLEMGDANRTDEVSATSMVDSESGLDISPDDVVGVIGPKHFWKARRAIANQQRVFAVQVFELHRLIKVQKLISASPHLLLDNSSYLSRPPSKNPVKNLSGEYLVKSQSHLVNQKASSQKANSNSECPTENMAGVPPLTPCEKGSVGRVLEDGPYSGSLPSNPMASDNKPNAWCFPPPPGNQWLIPVMSPSEGLIYKPYTGPCPPAAGFMAPIYGACGPLSMPTVPVDFMNTAYGVPASHQQQNISTLPGAPAVAPNYFPTPYDLPVVKPVISTTAVEQVNPMAGARPNGQAEQHSRNSCNVSHPKIEAFPGCAWKFQASRDSDLQGSTASSPCERGQEGRDALPLFPLAPALDGSGQQPEVHGRDHQSHVIKVVPHNRRSATESAARIFRSIQKERQQFDS